MPKQPTPKHKNEVFFFKSNLPTTNWASNFAPCDITIPDMGTFPSVEHAFQAIAYVHPEDIPKFFVKGAPFATWESYEDYCRSKSVLPRKRPSNMLIGNIAKSVANPENMRMLGIRPRTSKPLTMHRKEHLLAFLYTIKYSNKNPHLKQKLLDTTNKFLIEKMGRGGKLTPWEGRCIYEKDEKTGKPTKQIIQIEGENIVGRLLMDRRAVLQKDQST